MTVETASYISQFDTTLPTASDPKSEGDNHLRLVKSVLKTQFPNFGTAAMTASHTELNYMVGVTSSVQNQLNARALKAGDTYTGAHNFTGASSVTGPTPTTGDSSTKLATTAFVAATAFTAALPAQTGNAGKILNTDGTTATWTNTFTTSKSITGDLTLSGAARRIYGDFSAATRADRLLFTDINPASGSLAFGLIPRVLGGIGTALETYSDPDPDNSGLVRVFCNKFAGKSGLSSERNGTGVTQPLVLQMDGDDALQIDANKTIRSVGGGGIGYGTGSGGTVTQLTSKSTAVTLNKPCGRVTMNNAALAASAIVSFSVNNSMVGEYDTVLLSGVQVHDWSNYRLGVSVSNGVFIVTLQNVSAVSRSEALVINFSVIKGATT